MGRIEPGTRFGRLTALEATDQRADGGSVVWRCRCDCGQEKAVSAKRLKGGITRSCGCLQRGRPVHAGERFGRLTTIEYIGKRSGQHLWRCRCDCGGEATVRQAYLLDGHTRSCGCLQRDTLLDGLGLQDGTSAARLEASRKRLPTNNTSGCTGVYFNAKRRRWHAQIAFKGKTYYLGTFERFEDAVRARRQSEALHEDFLQAYYAAREKAAGERPKEDA